MYSFNKNIEQIREALNEPLPGIHAQLKMFPADRVSTPDSILAKDVKEAAVLIHLFPVEEEVFFILTIRNENLKVHAGQVSFPGGRKEERDEDLKETAVREAVEEVGLQRDSMEVLGALSKVFIPPTLYQVSPFVSYSRKKPLLQKEDREVSEILCVSVKDLLNDENVKEKLVDIDGRSVVIPYFELSDNVVWGATAIILSELKEIMLKIYGLTSS
jgi:8-oxo-dGTP pyrophosphatase MutT (NUDIX family)